MCGYLSAAILLTLQLVFDGPALAQQAVAIGAIAFVVQSLAVDLPIIHKVRRGAPVVETATAGATPQIILKRTAMTWLPLALILWLASA